MAVAYRAGFVRDTGGDINEDFTVASTSSTLDKLIRGFSRRIDDASESLRVTTAPGGVSMKGGFLRAPITGDLDSSYGALYARQELDLTAPVFSVFWQCGFLREVGTLRLMWVLAGTPGLVATMQNGFMRSQRGDLVLD